mgnify:CR=1 FL=1
MCCPPLPRQSPCGLKHALGNCSPSPRRKPYWLQLHNKSKIILLMAGNRCLAPWSSQKSLHKQTNVLSKTDITDAFLRANLTDGVFFRVRPPSELTRLGLVPYDILWVCQKAAYGLKGSPKLWEKERDDVLATMHWSCQGSSYYLQ